MEHTLSRPPWSISSDEKLNAVEANKPAASIPNPDAPAELESSARAPAATQLGAAHRARRYAWSPSQCQKSRSVGSSSRQRNDPYTERQ